jgi:hypothetical protein
MLSFKIFITETFKKGENKYASKELFERLVAHHIHQKSAARKNAKNNEHMKHNQSRMDELHTHIANQYGGADELKKVHKHAKNAANAYLKSIDPKQIVEVHAKPSMAHLRSIDPSANATTHPHDLIVKLKDGSYHGSSLKKTAGFASSLSANHVHPSLKSTWTSSKNSGVAAKRVAKQHALAFNSMSKRQQLAHIRKLLRAPAKTPVIPFHITTGNGVSEDYRKINSVKALSAPHTTFHATVRRTGANRTHIYAIHHDENGNKIGETHISTTEHRLGSEFKPRAFTKFGSKNNHFDSNNKRVSVSGTKRMKL